jgi:hypothetical protein
MFFVLPFVIQVNGKQIRIRIKTAARAVQIIRPNQPGRAVSERGFSNGWLRRLLMNPPVN